MPLRERSYSYRLLLAIAALTLAFFGSSTYANWRTLAIDSEADGLEKDALPDIEHASAAADALYRLESAADDYPDLGVPRRTEAKDQILATLATVDTEVRAYLALPAAEGERARLGDVRGALGQVHEAVQALFDEVDLEAGPTHVEAGVRRVRAAVER